jgi:hypothetical protein
LAAPTPKKAIAVATALAKKRVSMERSGITNGISGTSPTKTNATKVARAARIWTLDFQAELFREHGVHPEPAILRDHLNHTFERVTREAFGGEDLAHLFAFALGDLLDLPLLAPPGFFDLLALALGPLVVAHGHAEAVCQQVCEAEHNDHEPGETRSHGPRHHREGGDAAVDAAQDRVAEIARSVAVLEPSPHHVRAVFGLQPVTSLVIHLGLARSRLLPASSERSSVSAFGGWYATTAVPALQAILSELGHPSDKK